MGPRGTDLTGQTFGRWYVIENIPGKRGNLAYWKCRCECGAEKVVSAGHLKSGASRSCGCLSAELAAKRTTTHGRSNRKCREYWIWMTAKDRCFNPNCKEYKYYGARGITMCKEWAEDFMKFFDHIGKRPSKKYTLERLDNNRGYEPGNVKWATRDEQGRNKRNNVWLEYGGERLILAEWARRLKVNDSHLSRDMKKFGYDLGKWLEAHGKLATAC